MSHKNSFYVRWWFLDRIHITDRTKLMDYRFLCCDQLHHHQVWKICSKNLFKMKMFHHSHVFQITAISVHGPTKVFSCSMQFWQVLFFANPLALNNFSDQVKSEQSQGPRMGEIHRFRQIFEIHSIFLKYFFDEIINIFENPFKQSKQFLKIVKMLFFFFGEVLQERKQH